MKCFDYLQLFKRTKRIEKMKDLNLTPSKVRTIMKNMDAPAEMIIRHSDMKHIKPLKLKFKTQIDCGLFGTLHNVNSGDYFGSIFLNEKEDGFNVFFSTEHSYFSASFPIDGDELFIINS